MEDKKFALTTWSSNEHHDLDFERGIILVTDKLRSELLQRKIWFDEIWRQDRSVLYLEFHGSPVEYVTDEILSDWTDARGLAEEKWVLGLQDGDETVEIPMGFSFEDAEGKFRSECDHTIVKADGVHWSCIPKNSSLTIETATLTWEQLGL